MLLAAFFHCSTEVKMESFYSCKKKIWSTENNVPPNHDDINHVFTIMIDVDLGDGRMARTNLRFDPSKITKPSISNCHVAAL
jgi:hypothetical protein